MAAPSNTVWGSIVGGYGRIGISVSTTNTNTSTMATIEIWFWSKYSISDAVNSLFFNDYPSASAGATTAVPTRAISTPIVIGSGWSTDNQFQMGLFNYTYSRGTSAKTRYLYAKLSDVDRVGGTMYANATFSVPALPTYTITYNANGGSGAPSSQTKTHGKTFVLSTTKPTRTGYTFQGWATSSSATTAAYAAGGSYTSDASITLYAVWKANTYAVTYNANGGSGAPANQTKTHGITLTLSSTTPTRTNYEFLGWAISAAATTATYSASGSYTSNSAVTLYAVWKMNYVLPSIYNLTASRCDSAGSETDDGTCGLIKFGWKCTYDVSSITIAWSSTAGTGSATVTPRGTSGSISQVIGNDALSTDASYTITVTVSDSGGTNNATTTLSGNVFPLDCLAGGKGIAFGKPAELEDVADFAFDAKFNKPVYGKALGMDKLPSIPANSDLNSYMEPGCYAVYRNDTSETIANIPVKRAGRLEVWSSTGEGIRLAQWSYLRQRYIPYNSSNAVWEREITRNESNVWTYYDWWQSSLTPIASKKVYSKAAVTIGLQTNTYLAVLKQYSLFPFNRTHASTSTRLALADSSISIGANIDYVKVSGQVLIKCGSESGDRHIRIQRISGTATHDVSWTCVYGTASRNTAYTLPPMVVSVKEGDLLRMVYYTSDTSDYATSGSSTNGWQTYLTVEEL